MQNNIAVVSFYSFVDIKNPDILLPQLLLIGKKKLLRGTILIASEGINGSASGKEADLRTLLVEIIKLTNSQDLSIKFNYCEEHPFRKFKIRIKPEIVSLNIGSLDVNNLKGEYINSTDWDKFITREDVVIIDTRNDYEIELGSFRGAISPHTSTFKKLPDWVEKNQEMLNGKKIAMYCTGGIRCEKSTAYLKQLGFNEIYHLKGGILQYLADTDNENNLWQGECFVFDDRRAVTTELSPVENQRLERE